MKGFKNLVQGFRKGVVQFLCGQRIKGHLHRLVLLEYVLLNEWICWRISHRDRYQENPSKKLTSRVSEPSDRSNEGCIVLERFPYSA